MHLLWDNDTSVGFVIEPADRFEQTRRSARALTASATWGEVRAAALAPWAAAIVESHAEDVMDDQGASPADDGPWDTYAAAEAVTDHMPLPHDAQHLASWLDPTLLAAHVDVSGAAPGGFMDTAVIDDPAALLEALSAAGHTVEHRPGFLNELFG